MIKILNNKVNMQAKKLITHKIVNKAKKNLHIPYKQKIHLNQPLIWQILVKQIKANKCQSLKLMQVYSKINLN